MGTVYHASDRLTGQKIALKQITRLSDLQEDTPGSDFRVALSNEFRALASLRHPNIITVLDYGFDAGQPYFTMELLSVPKTLLMAAQGAPLSTCIQLMIELLQALAYLHRRGILHRDLKPGNVLVAEDGTVKVLDFGLSLMQTHSLSKAQESTAGTLAYMAPELFSEEAASVASDLYAVGVMAVEILTGHHPFNQKNVALLINSILYGTPDMNGVDDKLVPIIETLLAKDPSERYAGAGDVIRALCDATGRTLPYETAAVRESFLQAARFVGRERELQQLKLALSQMAREAGDTTPAIGSTWLVGGESGVGKSRLLDEMRVRALVQGTLVVRGQAITEGSVPYHLWRDPLRRLVLTLELSDDEASVLKALVPDIETLLEKPVPDAPQLDPQMSQNRLMKVVTDIFQRLQQPTVIILEDMQWAGEENLALLKRLMALVSTLPLMLVGSYRNDESPGLPAALPDAMPVMLKRLDAANIATLSEAILGDTGSQPEIVNFLQRETEGNIFFVIEMVRALAEQAGQLDRISETTLREKLLPGGIRAIVTRRLERVPAEAYALLQMAAVAGRELDVRLLEAVDEASEGGLAAWLATCAGASVLEVQEDEWRFAHDKLREALVGGIAPETLKTMHLKLAASLERLYPDAPAQIPAMAHHFQQAGIRDKAIHYLKRAGQQAEASHANDAAIEFYRAAIEELKPLMDADVTREQWQKAFIDLHESMGDILELTGKHEDARSALHIAIHLMPAGDIVSHARLQRKIGKAWENHRGYP